MTRATSVGSVASVPTPTPAGPAVALPPREATFVHTAAIEDDAATDDEHTALVAPTRPVRAPTARRQRRAGPWLLAILLVAVGGVGVVVAAGALRGDDVPVPPDAGVTVVTIAPDAGPPTVVALAPDATPVDAAAAPPALASLDVITTPPGAKVQLAGREAPPQKAPASFLDLEPGDVAVHVTLDGHEPLDRDVTLAPGERRTLELALIKKELPRDRDRDRDRKPAIGTLNVRTTPYSVVYSGGKKLGETPFVIKLPAGSYTLTFKNPDRGTTTRRVTIRAGETTKLKFDL